MSDDVSQVVTAEFPNGVRVQMAVESVSMEEREGQRTLTVHSNSRVVTPTILPLYEKFCSVIVLFFFVLTFILRAELRDHIGKHVDGFLVESPAVAKGLLIAHIEQYVLSSDKFQKMYEDSERKRDRLVQFMQGSSLDDMQRELYETRAKLTAVLEREEELKVKYVSLETKYTTLETKCTNLETKCAALEVKNAALEAKNLSLEAKLQKVMAVLGIKDD